MDPLQPIEGNAQLSKGLPDWDAYGKHHPSQSCPNATPHHSVLVDSVSCTLHPQRVQEQKNQPLWQLLTPEQIGSGETWSLHLLKTTPWFCLTISLSQRLQLFKFWYQLGKRLTGFGRYCVIKGCTLLDKFKLLITVQEALTGDLSNIYLYVQELEKLKNTDSQHWAPDTQLVPPIWHLSHKAKDQG